jgi:hypothetical protein
MLYLVPLRGAWRQVTDRDRQLELVRQLLKLDFPQTDTISVAATTVSRNHEALGVRVTLLSIVRHQRRIALTAKVAVS